MTAVPTEQPACEAVHSVVEFGCHDGRPRYRRRMRGRPGDDGRHVHNTVQQPKRLTQQHNEHERNHRDQYPVPQQTSS